MGAGVAVEVECAPQLAGVNLYSFIQIPGAR